MPGQTNLTTTLQQQQQEWSSKNLELMNLFFNQTNTCIDMLQLGYLSWVSTVVFYKWTCMYKYTTLRTQSVKSHITKNLDRKISICMCTWIGTKNEFLLNCRVMIYDEVYI